MMRNWRSKCELGTVHVEACQRILRTLQRAFCWILLAVRDVFDAKVDVAMLNFRILGVVRGKLTLLSKCESVAAYQAA